MFGVHVYVCACVTYGHICVYVQRPEDGFSCLTLSILSLFTCDWLSYIDSQQSTVILIHGPNSTWIIGIHEAIPIFLGLGSDIENQVFMSYHKFFFHSKYNIEKNSNRDVHVEGQCCSQKIYKSIIVHSILYFPLSYCSHRFLSFPLVTTVTA